MKAPRLVYLLAWSLTAAMAPCWCAAAPRNAGVTFNGEVEPTGPLPSGQWHTVVAAYSYPGSTQLLTNTYLVFARGGDQLRGFYVGYHVPTNQLAIVKHGFWNATEATGQPGEVGKVIENDQGYIDCERTQVDRTTDAISVSYRIKFKPGVLKGTYNVFEYIEDRDVRYDGFTAMGSVMIDTDGAVHRTDMPASWLNSLRPPGKPTGRLLLADRGVARYALLVPRAARRIETKAASDLRLCLRLICGADLPVVSEGDAAAAARPFISLGRTDRLSRSSCRWKSTDLAAEGYAIEVVDGNVYVYGGSGRGLMHGVYSLLEEDLGCRWYSLTSVDTPHLERLSVSLVPRRYVPPLELRDPYIYKMHDPTWSLRNKTNTPHARIPLAWGGSIRYHSMGHTYAAYFPTEQYFAAHPEYYALVNGKRQPSQLCHTNEDVIRLSIEKTCDIFRSHPEVTITAIGPNDGRGFCDCPSCKRLNDENGGRSGSFFYFVNRIAEGVKKEFPQNHLISLAYLDYARPPTKLKVDPYIIIQLCTDSHAWKYQFCFQWESEEFQSILKAWHARNARMFVWDYTTDYVHFLLPMANWPVVAANTRFMVKNGVAGIMYESELNDIDEMRGWVWAKQLWNPALDAKALLKDFVFGYYKESAQPIWDHEMMMWAYWDTWHRVPHRCGAPSDNPLLRNLQCSYAPDGPMFTPDFMVKMRACFDRAEALARSGVIRDRLRRAKLSLLYLELAQGLGYYSEFGDFIYGHGAGQSRAARRAYASRLDEFTSICRQCELTSLGIPITVDRITAKWRACIDAETLAPPKAYLPDEWVFAADPADRGVGEKWYTDARFYDAAARRAAGAPLTSLGKGMTVLHINRGVGWEQQGFPGMDRYGWYFQNLAVPADLAARKHLYLDFFGVNEEAWVYVNGELASERSYASTGRGVGELAGPPLVCDVKRWIRPGAANRLAIRVAHSSGLGGIWLPAMMVATDDECSPEALARFRD